MSRAIRLSWVWPLAVALTVSAAEPPAPPKPAAKPKELPASYYADLARVHHSYRQLDEAARLYQKALGLEKDAARKAACAGSLAEIYVAQKKLADALPLLRQAIAGATSRAVTSRYRMLVAQIAEQSNDPAAAEAAYREAVAGAQHDFERAAALRKLLLLYKRSGKLDEVVAEREKRVAANPKDVAALDLLVVAYTTVARDRDKALAALTRLAEARPDPATLRRLAAACQNAGRHKDAIATYQRLLELDPQNHAYYCEQLSQLHAATGDKDAALAWAKKIVAKSPDSLYAATRLARLLVRLGHPQEAVAHYERAAAKATSDAERERTLLACANAARAARLHDKAEAILRALARDSKSADHRAQAKRALFQLYEELNRLDELQIETKEEPKKP